MDKLDPNRDSRSIGGKLRSSEKTIFESIFGGKNK